MADWAPYAAAAAVVVAGELLDRRDGGFDAPLPRDSRVREIIAGIELPLCGKDPWGGTTSDDFQGALKRQMRALESFGTLPKKYCNASRCLEFGGAVVPRAPAGCMLEVVAAWISTWEKLAALPDGAIQAGNELLRRDAIELVAALRGYRAELALAALGADLGGLGDAGVYPKTADVWGVLSRLCIVLDAMTARHEGGAVAAGAELVDDLTDPAAYAGAVVDASAWVARNVGPAAAAFLFSPLGVVAVVAGVFVAKRWTL